MGKVSKSMTNKADGGKILTASVCRHVLFVYFWQRYQW